MSLDSSRRVSASLRRSAQAHVASESTEGPGSARHHPRSPPLYPASLRVLQSRCFPQPAFRLPRLVFGKARDLALRTVTHLSLSECTCRPALFLPRRKGFSTVGLPEALPLPALFRIKEIGSYWDCFRYLGRSLVKVCFSFRVDWMLLYQGMVVLAASQVWWTWEVEDVFRQVQKGEKQAMKNYGKKMHQQIDELVTRITAPLSRNDRKKYNTVLIIDVHARDIVDSFIRGR